MLTPEQAKEQLAQWQTPNEHYRLADGVQELPESLREIAKVVFEIEDEKSKQLNFAEQMARGAEVAAALPGLDLADRTRLFELVSPQLAPAIEATWQLLPTTPYRVGYTCKAFRAPGQSQFYAEKLYSWLKRIGLMCGHIRAEVLTPTWVATWASHLRNDIFGASTGALLAGVLRQRDAEGDEVFEILRQSLTNQHEIGGMGRHVYTAFLLSDRESGWELMEKTLLAAQRQEGLRQAILECIDETHPVAFRRMLQLILEQDLVRFSSVVRAFDVWFGMLWSSASAGHVRKMLEHVVKFLDDPVAGLRALTESDAEAAYFALWCAATEDALASVPLAQQLLSSKSVEMRYVAAKHLMNLELKVALAALIPAIDDEDLRVAMVAYTQIAQGDADYWQKLMGVDDRFDRVERLLPRVPEKPTKLKPIVWPWTEITVKRPQVAGMLPHVLGEQPATRLIAHLPNLEPGVRGYAANCIVKRKPWDEASRRAIVELVGDASKGVRDVAIKALGEQTLAAGEAEQIEPYLSRKTEDLRRGVLSLLLKQEDSQALASARRLLAAKDASRRSAGLELLRLLTDAKRAASTCRELAASVNAEKRKLTKDEETHLAEILKEQDDIVTLDNALGLMNPAELTPVVPPRNLQAALVTPAALACLTGIDEFIHAHRDTPVVFEFYGGKQTQLLSTVHWLPHPEYAKPRATERKRLPLVDMWEDWLASRREELRDADGMELVRAIVLAQLGLRWAWEPWKMWTGHKPARQALANAVSGGQELPTLQYSGMLPTLLDWLLYLSAPLANDFLLDAIETLYSLVPEEDIASLARPEERPTLNRFGQNDNSDWRDARGIQIWESELDRHVRRPSHARTPEQSVRLWRLMHWRDQPMPHARRRRPDPELLFTAFQYQAATLADVADQLLSVDTQPQFGGAKFQLLARFTQRKPDADAARWLAQPDVRNLVDSAVSRILEIELNRGDSETPVTLMAHAIRSISGTPRLARVLAALGKSEFKLGERWGDSGKQDRRQTLTHLAAVAFPEERETVDDFVRIMKHAIADKQFPEERLLQLTFLAPQWAKCVEAYFGWENMCEGVYWFLAHMRHVGGAGENAALAAGVGDSAAEAAGAQATQDDEVSEEAAETATPAAANNGDGATEQDSVSGQDGAPQPERPKLTPWQRLILERTPLSDYERNEGAIDVNWFRRTREQLGDRTWQSLAKAARFAANASQAKRAQFIADVLSNNVSRSELVDGIEKRQLKEYVRLLGLLPLAKGAKREADLIERCRLLREYRRYANQLSGLTKPAALLSLQIGLTNLAQTAGFADPLRLEWAVGAEAVKDLAQGPVAVTKDGVTVTLSLNELSKPELKVERNGKPLKSIPPDVKKDKQVAELAARVTDLKRQASSIRQSLEAAMCRGDQFTGDELKSWCGHALLAPLLSRLVIVGEGIAGYPVKGGKALQDASGKLEPVKAKETLRLAHPHDLLQTGAWHDWQRECFQAERVQPFKQVFRELYVVTKQEKIDGAISNRYAGQQVQPRQALALFGHRGWNTADGIFKIFHDEAVIVEVGFENGIGTPLEIEGATFSVVYFRHRDHGEPLPLADVPPRLFSEVMRDLDLVVSVAHAGGVDPEASASTVEMREALLRETCALLSLNNVKFKPSHAVIKGTLAEYNVHLGSGSVHRMPGGAMCIVPVHAQHRGRLFLPFADDDPRTAEVISKVLLLARDHEIQDPTILEQIRL